MFIVESVANLNTQQELHSQCQNKIRYKILGKFNHEVLYIEAARFMTARYTVVEGEA